MNMKYLILIALLIPVSASALICERNGTCADKSLNRTYEIKKELREIKDQQRQDTRDMQTEIRTLRSEADEDRRQLQDIKRRKKITPTTNTWHKGYRY